MATSPLKLLFLMAFKLALAPITPTQAAAQELTITAATRDEWAAVGQVRGRKSGHSVCTGTLISPDTVLTAAHCVVHPKTGKVRPLYSINFAAGWHYGDHHGWSLARDVKVHPDYRAGRNAERAANDRANFAVDLALITLRDPVEEIAAMPVAASSDFAGAAAVLGYQNKNREALIDYVGCQARSVDEAFLALSCGVKSGTSGGPVFTLVNGAWQLTGVVVAALNGKNSPIRGLAVRIDAERMLTIFD